MSSILNECYIVSKIVQYTGDRIVLWILRKYMNPAEYNEILLNKRRILIYGQVQSGKTAAILAAMQRPLYDNLRKIIVIQNSLLVLKQYQQRLDETGLSYQIVNTKTCEITADIVILMNNKMRYTKLQSIALSLQKYILFMDESDSYERGRHPLSVNAIHEYYVTATPQHKTYMTPGFFHTVERVAATSSYKGLHNITVEYNDTSVISIVDQFLREINTGMLLINAYRYISEMESVGYLLMDTFAELPIVILNTERKLLYKGKTYRLNMAISEIIDFLKKNPHIVFIANRMSLRGLSYCSSDYSRHLTHQYSNFKDGITITNSLQRMRLLGKYVDDVPLKLILPSNNESRVVDMFNALDMQFEVSREFTL